LSHRFHEVVRGHTFEHTLNRKIAGTANVYIAAVPVANITAHNALNAVGQRTVKHMLTSLQLKSHGAYPWLGLYLRRVYAALFLERTARVERASPDGCRVFLR
jgi:hypothetical protein